MLLSWQEKNLCHLATMPFDLYELHLFHLVLTHGSFTKAATAAGLTQSALTRQIQGMEQGLGLPLLERTTRSVKLSPSGEQFVARARYALAQIDEVVPATRRFARGSAGQLDIGFTNPMAYRNLPWILREFNRLRPNVEITLHSANTIEQVQLLVAGKLHFGFLRLPVLSQRLTTVSLEREGFVVALPRDHVLATREQVLLEDLADEDFIAFAQVLGVHFQEQAVSYCHRAGFTPRVRIQVLDTNEIMCFVAAGFGIAILPDYLRRLMHPEVVFKPLTEIPALIDQAAAWLTDDASAASEAFREVIHDFLRQHPID